MHWTGKCAWSAYGCSSTDVSLTRTHAYTTHGTNIYACRILGARLHKVHQKNKRDKGMDHQPLNVSFRLASKVQRNIVTTDQPWNKLPISTIDCNAGHDLVLRLGQAFIFLTGHQQWKESRWRRHRGNIPVVLLQGRFRFPPQKWAWLPHRLGEWYAQMYTSSQIRMHTTTGRGPVSAWQQAVPVKSETRRPWWETRMGMEVALQCACMYLSEIVCVLAMEHVGVYLFQFMGAYAVPGWCTKVGPFHTHEYVHPLV